MRSIIIFCVFLYSVSAKHEKYDGYVVYEVHPKNIEEINILNSITNELLLDTWSYATLVNPGEVFVSGPKRVEFENALTSAGIPYRTVAQNIREMLELEEQRLATAAIRPRSSKDSAPLSHIYTLDEANNYLEEIASKYPSITKLVDAGTSVEGRTIKYLEISTTGFENVGKPIVMVQALLHSREWVTLPVALYAIHKLVVDVSDSSLHNIDWIVMPVANPDGYEYSHVTDRFWRKNLRPGQPAHCPGVDLNRNFDINWGTISHSNWCSETFHGSGPNSEPETQAIVKIHEKYSGRIALYIDLHSFGSMILYGWGNGTLVPNALTLHVAGVQMAQAIDDLKWAAKPNYVVGNIVGVLHYGASGGTSDYAQKVGVPFSYTYELPGLLGTWGLNSFLVDPDFIEQAAFETWAGIVAGAKHVLSVWSP